MLKYIGVGFISLTYYFLDDSFGFHKEWYYIQIRIPKSVSLLSVLYFCLLM